MLAGHSGFLPAISSALLVTDVILMHAALLRGPYWPWGYAPSGYVFPAAVGGLILGVVLTGTPIRRPQGLGAIALCAACWAAAGFLTDWAFSEGILGPRSMPQWWVTVYPGPGCVSGLAFLSGQTVAGTVAGLGLLGPVLLKRQLALASRIAWALGLLVVTALAWTATYHGRWVT